MSTKKFLSLMIIVFSLVFVVGTSLVVAAELINNSGMETGNTSGWSINGAGTIAVTTVQKHSGTYSLLYTGRTAAWNGPLQNLTSKVQSGKIYACSGWVRLDNATSGSIKMSIKKTDGSGTTYTNVATGTGNNSSWVQLSGSYSLSVSGTLAELSIYFEGPNSGVNMYIDDVSVSDGVTPTPTPTPVTTPTPTPVTSPTGWVGTWGTSMQLTESSNMPPSPGLTNNTLRQIVRVSLGGSQVRLKFSNQYGTSPVVLNSVHLAVSTGGSSINASTDKTLTFGGSQSVTIPTGQTVTSDTLNFSLLKQTNMAISIYFGSTSSALTGHPSSRATSYIQTGNNVSASNMSSAVATEHWYIISGIDVLTDGTYKAVVALGDSITDGRGSTTNGNDRYTDNLAGRLLANTATSKVGVLSEGIGGNCVLSGGLGPTARTRFDRDVLGQSGVRFLIILEGVNDIGNSSASTVATDLINAYKEFISKAHAKNILVYGGTILPFGGNSYYSTVHEQARQTVNSWIRSSGQFDAIVDFDAALRNPSDQTKLLSTYDSGDHLHPNPAGYKKMADIIDLNLFTN